MKLFLTSLFVLTSFVFVSLSTAQTENDSNTTEQKQGTDASAPDTSAPDTSDEKTASDEKDSSDKKPRQRPKPLGVGDPAPVLDIENWVSDGNGHFEPVTEFEEGKIYILEFWAIACGPCLSVMPHVAELQEKHLDDGVQIIGVGMDPLARVEKFLDRTVPGSEETFGEVTSKYCLTSDPDGSTFKDYMVAARKNGIPYTFIVGKTGLIEWSGHPLEMDDVLPKIISDQWDHAAYELEAKFQAEVQALFEQHQYAEAVEMVGPKMETLDVDSDQYQACEEIRYISTLLQGGDTGTKEFNDHVSGLEDNEEITMNCGLLIHLKMARHKVPSELLEAAIGVMQKVTKEDPEMDQLACLVNLLHMNDRTVEAVAILEKALVEIEDLNEGTEASIQRFLKQLKEELPKEEATEEATEEEEVTEEEVPRKAVPR